MKNLPNFFIVGAAKSGTTSLWQYLRQHPQIYMPDDELCKEPGYFSDLRPLSDLDQYLGIFNEANDKHKRIGEASTCYLTSPDSPEKIRNFSVQNKLDVKIIIVLRNPADRAYSLYNWMVQDGYEYVVSFEKALSLEKKRSLKKIPNFFDPEYYYNYLYFESGLYFEQVNRYMISMGRENVHVLIFEDFVKDPASYLKQIYHFLGVECWNCFHCDQHNPSYMVRYPPFQFILRKLTRVLQKATKFRYKEKRDFLLNLGLKDSRPKKINPLLRNKLLQAYKEDIGKLEILLERDLSFWFE